VKLVAVCDAHADFRQVRALVDRALLTCCDWMSGYASDDPDVPEAHTLDVVRMWRGLEDGSEFSRPADVKRLAEHRDHKRWTHVQGFGGGSEAKTIRKALLLARRLLDADDVAAIIVIRDSENDPGRMAALEDARQSEQWPWTVLLGVQHPMREAWVLAALQPTDEQEREGLARVAAELGFDPRQRSAELRARSEAESRHPKRVLREILHLRGAEREVEVFWRAVWDEMKALGQHNGLAAFILEVETFARSQGGSR
jgi:hypothetical protein